MKYQNLRRMCLAPLMLGGLFLSGCATTPVAHKVDAAGVSATDLTLREFAARAEVLDRKSGQINTVDIDFVAQGRQALRMDVVGTFATPVAVVALSNNELTCLLPRQKRYYRGPASSAALASAIGVRLDPALFFNLLYDEVPQSADWQCRKNAAGELESCENLKTSQTLTWQTQQGGRRKLVINDKRFQLTMGLHQVPTKVQDATRVFSLGIPTGYTSL